MRTWINEWFRDYDLFLLLSIIVSITVIILGDILFKIVSIIILSVTVIVGYTGIKSRGKRSDEK